MWTFSLKPFVLGIRWYKFMRSHLVTRERRFNSNSVFWLLWWWTFSKSFEICSSNVKHDLYWRDTWYLILFFRYWIKHELQLIPLLPMHRLPYIPSAHQMATTENVRQCFSCFLCLTSWMLKNIWSADWYLKI